MTIPKLALAACIATLMLAPTSAFARHHHRAHASIDANGNDSVTYLPHPAGIRRTAFCGAGAHYALTGEIVNGGTWAIADYWPGHYHGSVPVAHWSGHVAIIRQMYGDGTALMEDYNSGGHQSRLWRRSLAGAQILGGGAGAYASTDHSARRHRHHHERYAVAESPAAPDVALGVH